MKIDYHLHTIYSDDSEYPMEDVVKDAIAMGLDEICFTDHVDYGVKFDKKPNITIYRKGYELQNVDYPRYFAELDYLKEKYKDQINIKKGLEFGIQRHTIDRYNQLFNTYPMDFVLLSLHQIEDKEFWLFDYQVDKSVQEIYDGYYDELYQVIQNFDNYSCLAHLDLIRRYVDDTSDYYEHTKEKIDLILKHLIKNNKGIELNTSYERYGIDGITPSIKILKRYHELGGKIITIGSDSHKKEHLAHLIPEARELLKEIGFEYFCTFNNMDPVYYKL